MAGEERLDLSLDGLHQHALGAIPQDRQQRVALEVRSWPWQADNGIFLHGVSSRVTFHHRGYAASRLEHQIQL